MDAEVDGVSNAHVHAGVLHGGHEIGDSLAEDALGQATDGHAVPEQKPDLALPEVLHFDIRDEVRNALS